MNPQEEKELLIDLQNDFCLDEALEESFMEPCMPYEELVDKISDFREKGES